MRLGDRALPIAADTACSIPVGVRHGYRLSPAGRGPGVALHIKLAGAGSDPASAMGAGACALDDAARMRRSVMEIRALRTRGEESGPAWLGAVAAVILRWPDAALDAPAAAGDPVQGVRRSRRAASRHARDVAPLFGLIEDRLDDPPGLDELAGAAHLSTRQLVRVFRGAAGCSPHEYIARRRLERARTLLMVPSLRITEVSERLGFASPAVFSRGFRQHAGMTPRAYRLRPDVAL